jgi:phosphoesterase RecJ-like protein
VRALFSLLESKHAKRVGVFSHISADGDCLGAQCGLSRILSQAGYEVDMYNQQPIAENIMFIPGAEKVHTFEKDTPIPDLCIAVDCADYKRMGQLPQMLESCTWINIDHHVSNTKYGAYNKVNGQASSTCEIIAEMALASGVSVDPETATALYSGISTDTGSFMFSNVSAYTMRLAADMLDKGADSGLVRNNFYEHTSRKQVGLYRYLYNHIVFLHQDAVAYCAFSKEDMAALGVVKNDFDGVVSLIRNIAGVELSILFLETEKDHVKISMRSREWFDVNACCNRLGGGGHVRAAGASLEKPLQEAVQEALAVVDEIWETNRTCRTESL